MRTKSSPTRVLKPAAPGFFLPAAAHLSLIQMRDHLRLLARLTDTGTVASDLAARVAPDAMAWCFAHLARDLDAVIGAADPQIH